MRMLVLIDDLCFPGLFYVLCIGGSSLVVGLNPLYYEMLCDCIYPVSEGSAAAVLNLTQNLTQVLFLLVTLIHGIGNLNSSLLIYTKVHED